MRDSETFGIAEGYGDEVIAWLNAQATTHKTKIEFRLYGYKMSTKNFGNFEMFSWVGNPQIARRLVIKASKRFRVNILEGGYKPKEKIFKLNRADYAKVKRGDKTIGILELYAPRFGSYQWKVKDEERH